MVTTVSIARRSPVHRVWVAATRPRTIAPASRASSPRSAGTRTVAPARRAYSTNLWESRPASGFYPSGLWWSWPAVFQTLGDASAHGQRIPTICRLRGLAGALVEALITPRIASAARRLAPEPPSLPAHARQPVTDSGTTNRIGEHRDCLTGDRVRGKGMLDYLGYDLLSGDQVDHAESVERDHPAADKILERRHAIDDDHWGVAMRASDRVAVPDAVRATSADDNTASVSPSTLATSGAHGIEQAIVALCFGILHRVTDPIALLQALADVLTPGGEIVLETYGSHLPADAPAFEVHGPGDVYARDDFVYWGFPPEGLRRLGRIVGLDEVEVVDQLEIDGHPRILAVLRAAG